MFLENISCTSIYVDAQDGPGFVIVHTKCVYGHDRSDLVAYVPNFFIS